MDSSVIFNHSCWIFFFFLHEFLLLFIHYIHFETNACLVTECLVTLWHPFLYDVSTSSGQKWANSASDRDPKVVLWALTHKLNVNIVEVCHWSCSSVSLAAIWCLALPLGIFHLAKRHRILSTKIITIPALWFIFLQANHFHRLFSKRQCGGGHYHMRWTLLHMHMPHPQCTCHIILKDGQRYLGTFEQHLHKLFLFLK